MVDQGIQGKKLKVVNWVRKTQEAMFMFCISAASVQKLDVVYLVDWKELDDPIYGRHRSILPVGK